MIFSFMQIATYDRMHKSEKLEYGKAAGKAVDITNLVENLAFRAYASDTDPDAVINPNIAEWKVRVVSTELRYSMDKNNAFDLPVKYCEEKDFKKFAPARIG